MFAPDLLARAEAVIHRATRRGLTLTTAESCTGGLVASLLTEIGGASAVFERGVVTYANSAKTALLGVPEAVLASHGAVSRACAIAMAEGALARADADIGLSVTGIAGPGGGSPDKPVGLVHFAAARRGRDTLHLERRFGDRSRHAIRMDAVEQALSLFEDALEAERR